MTGHSMQTDNFGNKEQGAGDQMVLLNANTRLINSDLAFV